MESDLQIEEPNQQRVWKQKKLWQRAKDYWSGFCRQTPIHGIKYLAEYDRPLYERLWWAIVLVVCLFYSYVYSMQLWYRLNIKPNIHQTETVTRYDDVVNIPLPAITFCDNMKFLGKNVSSDTTSFLCGQGYDTLTGDNRELDVNELIKRSPVFNSSCKICYDYSSVTAAHIMNYVSYCESMFTRILTQHGVCYTFNMLDVHQLFRDHVKHHYSSHGRLTDWSPETGYRKDAELVDRNASSDPLKEGPYPKRAIGWEVRFQLQIDIYSEGTYCDADRPGFKFSLHNPAEMPRMGHRDNEWIPAKDEEKIKNYREYMDLDYNREYYISIEPELHWSNNNLRHLTPRERNCYFHDERSLRYFKYYTQTNCENECLMNLTIASCECVDFYMPHGNDTKVCETWELGCVIYAFDLWKKSGMKQCACYSPCVELKYSSDLYYKRSSNADEKKTENGSIVLSVYLKDIQYVTKEQRKVEPKYFLVDFIANCGGVFGLFCGMSIISLIDFTYYGTLRLISNFCRKKYKKRQPSED